MRTRIKICGFTREADIDDALEAGADALGLNLYPKSPRAVSAERAAELAARIDVRGVELIYCEAGRPCPPRFRSK